MAKERKIILSQLKQLGAEVLQIIYPNVCLACGNALSWGQEFICFACMQNLPYTRFWEIEDNPMEMHLWGRFKFERAVALFHFEKSGKVQNLLHELKYRNQPKLGVFLGKLLGRKMKENMPCQYDTIIPVPLHPQRMLERGYNQAKMFALGLSEVLKCEVAEDILIRSKASPTQTKKTLFERLDNVANIFEIKDSARLDNKHILLVDDVLTTGATIESCANELIKAGNIRLSIATIAIA